LLAVKGFDCIAFSAHVLEIIIFPRRQQDGTAGSMSGPVRFENLCILCE
jgi:hypothetical protein